MAYESFTIKQASLAINAVKPYFLTMLFDDLPYHSAGIQSRTEDLLFFTQALYQTELSRQSYSNSDPSGNRTHVACLKGGRPHH